MWEPGFTSDLWLYNLALADSTNDYMTESTNNSRKHSSTTDWLTVLLTHDWLYYWPMTDCITDPWLTLLPTHDWQY